MVAPDRGTTVETASKRLSSLLLQWQVQFSKEPGRVCFECRNTLAPTFNPRSTLIRTSSSGQVCATSLFVLHWIFSTWNQDFWCINFINIGLLEVYLCSYCSDVKCSWLQRFGKIYINNTITDGGSTAPLYCWYHTEETTIQEHKRDWKDVRGIVGRR